MSRTQVVLSAETHPAKTCPATINIPSDFKIRSQDDRLKAYAQNGATTQPPPPLGVLSNFTGTFAGSGFNLIFRPNSGPPHGTTFPNPVSPPPPQVPSDNVLELNLTKETLSFSAPLGSIPNRGLAGQGDIFLNGVPYAQIISDVTNTLTGKADNKPSQIHFEPGLWMHVPATTSDPILPATLTRMASIPHGTTINAQCLAPTSHVLGPPTIPAIDITPFKTGSPNSKIPFASQTASTTNSPRLPQDLSKFIAAGTITQSTLSDPASVLRAANATQHILKSTHFTVSTQSPDSTPSGGTANIAFLEGNTNTGGPNANAVSMTATFWVSEVLHRLTVPAGTHGTLRFEKELTPTFLVSPPKELKEARTVDVKSLQIQYAQVVLLNFGGLTWPHVSVATLVPAEEIVVEVGGW